MSHSHLIRTKQNLIPTPSFNSSTPNKNNLLSTKHTGTQQTQNSYTHCATSSCHSCQYSDYTLIRHDAMKTGGLRLAFGRKHLDRYGINVLFYLATVANHLTSARLSYKTWTANGQQFVRFYACL